MPRRLPRPTYNVIPPERRTKVNYLGTFSDPTSTGIGDPYDKEGVNRATLGLLLERKPGPGPSFRIGGKEELIDNYDRNKKDRPADPFEPFEKERVNECWRPVASGLPRMQVAANKTHYRKGGPFRSIDGTPYRYESEGDYCRVEKFKRDVHRGTFDLRPPSKGEPHSARSATDRGKAWRSGTKTQADTISKTLYLSGIDADDVAKAKAAMTANQRRRFMEGLHRAAHNSAWRNGSKKEIDTSLEPSEPRPDPYNDPKYLLRQLQPPETPWKHSDGIKSLPTPSIAYDLIHSAR
mmetsp:Transcript_42750/g.110195  ORF Transcript_42750/g.110195 Transcript_42750/m.110195 type:complete len:294 (-) Transcript_42750:985-1866(-)|eukprot:CAMPEP_0113866782 /NCGR_PEP_ID=MMETSP0780_2-20120614/58_1 /TAXON_ID=652834 /ORGANISM="Palpitomonas bilix" /LENGTH=293 /DNA_ID=CAMNT_0000851659 /DNA_START=410 /DNA_END=1291 /DNA_ORIENTATION=- /assembly_acc=CAM_ASM_000599